jgi:WD repeat-containing protein 19
MGHIHYFFLEDWKLVTDFRHSVGIRELYADQMGSRLVVVDEKSEGYVYNPVSVVLYPDCVFDSIRVKPQASRLKQKSYE